MNEIDKITKLLKLKNGDLIVPFLNEQDRTIDINIFDYNQFIEFEPSERFDYPHFRCKKIKIQSIVHYSMFFLLKINKICFRFCEDELSIDEIANAKRLEILEWLKEQNTILEKNQETFPYSYTSDDYSKKIFRMFNVGQGCCSALYENNIPTLIFDIGGSRRCSGVVNLLSKEINDSRLHTFIISHYDSDHINMADLIPMKKDSRYRFFMPALLDVSLLSSPVVQQLFFKIINNKSEVVMFLNNKLITPIKYGNLTIYQGNMHKKDSNQSTNENSHGLLCLLKKDEKEILIPGDVLYNDLFTIISGRLKPTNVIIPHHSCNYRGNFKNIDLSDLKESFIFCGPHGGYKHPNYTHFSKYLKAPVVRLVRKLPSNCFDNGKVITDSYCTLIKADHYDW